MAVNQDRLLQDFSSPVELNRTLSDGFERNMAFPYSQGSRKEAVKQIPINKPVYHFSGADVKQRELSNGISHSDALVQNTEMTSNGQTMSYRVEHLASFQHISGNRELLPEDALKKLNEISEDGGLWSQLMIMKVSNAKLVMANGETNETIEEYSLENISLCTYVADHPAVNNIFIFSTRYSNDKVGAIHLFQCKSSEAAVIASDINKRRGGKDKMIAGEGVVNGGFSETSSPKINGHSKVADGEDAGDNVAKKNLENLGYVHDETDNLSSPRHGVGVHQRVEAFQKFSEPKPTEILRTGSRTSADYVSKETRQARINRDVEALNRCIETAEDFIVELKKMNDARKKLSVKGPKKSMKRKYEGARSLAKGPTEASTIDMYQKFKYAFNLLGKLKSHINSPNAPELVNYLFVPLEIIVKVLGHETARSVVSPLMTVAAIDLLTNCLRSRDHEFWKSLGPNWSLPQSAPMFHDRYITPYAPKFKDGWTPPEIVADERGAAAAKSTAAMVARMKESEFGSEKTRTMVARAVQRFRSLAHEAKTRKLADDEKRAVEEAKHHYETPPVPPVPVVATHVKKTVEETPKRQPVGELKFALVVYDYWAHNNKELTIRAGEKVVIIDDTRRWWLVRNNDDEQGYVPSTVLEVYNPGKFNSNAL
ncbi:epidermal growth factor receptor kinase substrate 8-like isoform X1 [Rhopilema esculentum]|uniref:epidermal growth factor receptor kinase substrate 8-like isoform X1 n=3 Tax=Rhopilema esculentum TaxID=499914 RepID=UPI0031D27607